MRNSLGDLNNNLFESLERLQAAENDGELELEIKRAKAVSEIGDKIIRNAALGLRAVELMGNAEVPNELRIANIMIYIATLMSIISGVIYVYQNRKVLRMEK